MTQFESAVDSMLLAFFLAVAAAAAGYVMNRLIARNEKKRVLQRLKDEKWFEVGHIVKRLHDNVTGAVICENGVISDMSLGRVEISCEDSVMVFTGQEFEAMHPVMQKHAS